MVRPTQWKMNASGYGRAPDICVDSSGRCWVAWLSRVSDRECVQISWAIPGDEWALPMACSERCHGVTGLSITPFETGVLVAWIEGHGDGSGGLMIKCVSPNAQGEAALVAPLKAKPAHPTLVSDSSRFALFWTSRTTAARFVEGCLGRSPQKIDQPFRLSVDDRTALYPVASPTQEGWIVIWQEMARRTASIVARQITGEDSLSTPETIIQETMSVPALPAICRDGPFGHWIAWHSDADPTREPGLVRWIHVVHRGNDGTLSQPVSKMPDIARDGRGEDQGFESPAITTLADGRLVVIGRGSQSVQRQDLGQAGWTTRMPIDESGWRCRGRRFPVAIHDKGLLIAGRDKEEITVWLLPYANGDCEGRPRLAVRQIPSFTGLMEEEREEQRHILGGYRVLFGDIHQHTHASDGTGTTEECYYRARVRYKDDVVAVSDHESFLGKQTPEGEWREQCRAADEFLEPGSFVTLQAFEWTGKMFPGPGHKVVYLPLRGGPLLSRDHAHSSTSKALLSECRQIGALVIPHHVGWTGADMDNHDADIQPCWEIVSCHGAYERSGVGPIGTRGDDKSGQFIGDALDRNLRFGFVGGSDGHGLNWHHGICRKEDSHRTGLTAFLCHDVTRDAVLEALKRRRCYATSGAKIGLWFEIDGCPMGEELITGTTVPFRIVVAGTAPIRNLWLVSNHGEETSFESKGMNASFHGTLPPPGDRGFSYYYVRVVQEDDEVAWSSPIWLDVPGPA